jgi:hypothetical protein
MGNNLVWEQSVKTDLVDREESTHPGCSVERSFSVGSLEWSDGMAERMNCRCYSMTEESTALVGSRNNPGIKSKSMFSRFFFDVKESDHQKFW